MLGLNELREAKIWITFGLYKVKKAVMDRYFGSAWKLTRPKLLE